MYSLSGVVLTNASLEPNAESRRPRDSAKRSAFRQCIETARWIPRPDPCVAVQRHSMVDSADFARVEKRTSKALVEYLTGIFVERRRP